MLTKEILCAYLPYNVRIASPKMKSGERSIMTLRGRHLNDDGTLGESLYKPLLRPLSSLTKPITHNGKTFVPAEILCPKAEYNTSFDWKVAVTSLELAEAFKFRHVAYEIVEKLLSWHFDIFGLLESGDAIELKEINNG